MEKISELVPVQLKTSKRSTDKVEKDSVPLKAKHRPSKKKTIADIQTADFRITVYSGPTSGELLKDIMGLVMKYAD